MNEQVEQVDGRTCRTELLIVNLVGIADDAEVEYLNNNIRAIMWNSARRLYVLNKAVNSLFIGLLVTNGVWAAHALGWI
ncbi:hypothetical protein EBT25_16920 [bacterium]|nr:hypothetical protein [bacterium]